MGEEVRQGVREILAVENVEARLIGLLGEDCGIVFRTRRHAAQPHDTLAVAPRSDAIERLHARRQGG